ncbi:MAG TPA: response regulator transcription factor [Puia sp.]|nr:response regulator transcription factor [Puia sp.]
MPITIVIVEDLDEVREGLGNFLSLDPDLLVAGAFKTADEAGDGIASLKPDVVIMDINLPGTNGIDCIRQIRSRVPATQFMMFTVYENDEKVFEALQAGASGYLLKSTGLPHIIEALKELHRGGSPMSANIARKLVKHFQQPPRVPAPDTQALSSRETDILHLLARGLLYKEIADQLSVSTSTVRQHIHHIYEKLHVQNRTEAINKVYRNDPRFRP